MRRMAWLEKAQVDRNVRLAAALALVLVEETTIVVVLAGDSGVRINRTTLLRIEKDLDLITSTLRREAWPIIGRKVSDPLVHEQMSPVRSPGTERTRTFRIWPVLLDADDMAGIERRAIAANIEALPHVPRADIENLVTRRDRQCPGRLSERPFATSGLSLSRRLSDPREPHPCRDISPRRGRHHRDLLRRLLQARRRVRRGRMGEGLCRSRAGRPREGPALPLSQGSTACTWADDRTYLGVRF